MVMNSSSSNMSYRELEGLRDEGLKSLYPARTKVLVGLASCGKAAGAGDIYSFLIDEFMESDEVEVEKTGCLGFCSKEPLIEIIPLDKSSVIHQNVSLQFAKELAQSLKRGELLEEGAFATRDYEGEGESSLKDVPELDSIPFYSKQEKIVLKNSGVIDPESIEEYVATGGYFTLRKILDRYEPGDVIEEVKESNLRGRGGAGFPTGVKWGFLKKADGDTKYLICNADEGDPGAYMDRTLLEGDPFSVLEGMTIGSYAMGAEKGYIYVRDEYPLAVERVKNAIETAREAGLLGENILGRGFDFDIEIKKGAGAFVCGEETALIASIESRRGNPRPRPPFPAQSGLWGKPTNINNVETWANIPRVMDMGAEKFSDIGTENSGGTKVFSLTGDVKNTGLVEVPLGTTLRELIFEVGGGTEDEGFKAVQTGGPSGGVIPKDKIDTPIDYETLDELGSIMGSGGVIVMSEGTCMVDQARFFMDFCAEESCGKCPPCRYGTKKILEILDRITKGRGEPEDIERLESLADTVKKTSLCGLGQTAPNPVLSTLKYFLSEYEKHIEDKECPAGQCRALEEMSYAIDAGTCVGCGLCIPECPEDAISGEQGEPHEIDSDLCISCGACAEVCPQGAISKRG